MQNYSYFAQFYDQVMGNRRQPAHHILNLVEKYHATAETLLELGCGTGSILNVLSERYMVTGIDLSTEMISIAMSKIPNAQYFIQDMTNFELPQKFDVIICVFDSINHVIEFEGWANLFKCVHHHLNDGGVFIFDMNTQAKLQRLIDSPPLFLPFAENYMMMDVTAAENAMSNWNIKVFEHQHDRTFELFEEDIKETAFPVVDVNAVLQSLFGSIIHLTQDGSPPSDQTERLFFVCQTPSQ